MIYLLYGENQIQSRRALTKLVGKYEPSAVTVLDGKSTTVDLIAACEARVLFSKKRLVVVEISCGQSVSTNHQLLIYLENLPVETDLVFWVGSGLRKTNALFKAVASLGEVCFFEKSKSKPFPFLDALGEKDARRAYFELRKLLFQGESEVSLLQLIAWEVRNLIRVWGRKEVSGMNPYVFKKSRSKSSNFSEYRLIELFGMILEADVAMKTGSDPHLVLDRLVFEITFEL